MRSITRSQGCKARRKKSRKSKLPTQSDRKLGQITHRSAPHFSAQASSGAIVSREAAHAVSGRHNSHAKFVGPRTSRPLPHGTSWVVSSEAKSLKVKTKWLTIDRKLSKLDLTIRNRERAKAMTRE